MLFGSCHSVVGIEENDQTYEEAVRADAPVLYLRFEEPAGDERPVRDEISRERLGFVFSYDGARSTENGLQAVRGVASASPRLGRAIELYTSEDRRAGGYVVLPNAPPELAFGGEAPFTIEFWGRFELDAGVDDFAHPISNVDVTSNGYVVEIGFDTAAGAYASGTRGTDVTSDAALQNGFASDVFHHYVFTYDARTGSKMFVDVKEGFCLACKGQVLLRDTASVLTIGGRWLEDGNAGNGAFVHGRVDEVAIYDRALSRREIAAHYRAARLPK